MANNILEVNKTPRKLIERYAREFHMIVARLLFMCKQARPEILNWVELLTTGVREPNEDDDKKLGRILKYLSGTRNIVLTLE